jgi:Domain of unknown function (DUF4357)
MKAVRMTETIQGRSLELYFIDGKPDGMLTAEVFNWTGHVLMTPRTQIAKALSRPEAKRTGVYLLFGEQDGKRLAYVGEAEDIGKRLRDHIAAKDWWTSAILVTTAGDSLHKAHVKYLESRLVQIAREIGGVQLDNGNAPPRPSLSEAHIANMEVFLDTLLLVLPAIRIDMFLSKKRPAKPVPEEETTLSPPAFELISDRLGLKANAFLDGAEFIVEAGSISRAEWVGSEVHDTSYRKLREELAREGVLLTKGDHARFTENYAFRSPSAAAAVVTGRPASGPAEWRVKGTRKTYKEWEAEQLAAGDLA